MVFGNPAKPHPSIPPTFKGLRGGATIGRTALRDSGAGKFHDSERVLLLGSLGGFSLFPLFVVFFIAAIADDFDGDL
jgi:hypothetical protein